MTPLLVAIICLLTTFGGGLFGIWLRRRLPGRLFSAGVDDSIKLGVGLVATMAALLLGLVMASAKTNFDAIDLAVRDAAVKVLTIDRALRDLGPEAGGARAAWRDAVEHLARERTDRHVPKDGAPQTYSETIRLIERAADAAGSVTPHTARQTQMQAKALDLMDELLVARWLTLFVAQSAVPQYVVMALLLWLAVTFVCFGLVSPRQGPVLVVFFLCALSTASALFITLELEFPFDDFVRVSWQPLQSAYRTIAP